MEDWSKARISDEEFIRGIYEKANKRQEKKHQSVMRSKWLSFGVSAAAACAFFVVGGAKLLPMTNKSNTPSETERAMYQPAEEKIQKETKSVSGPEVAQSDLLKGEVRDVIPVSTGAILTVSIPNEDQRKSVKNVKVSISKQLSESITRYLTAHNCETLVGKQVLLYPIYNEEQGNYIVDTADSFYLKEFKGDQTFVYCNLDGDVLEE